MNDLAQSFENQHENALKKLTPHSKEIGARFFETFVPVLDAAAVVELND